MGAVQPRVAGFARAIVYDRSGVGRSAPDPSGRTLARMAEDLTDLLDHFGPGPYLLVGHSAGSWFHAGTVNYLTAPASAGGLGMDVASCTLWAPACTAPACPPCRCTASRRCGGKATSWSRPRPRGR